MKAFENRSPTTLEEAVALAREALAAGRSVSFAGGGTDVLQLVKDRVPNRPGAGTPDVLVDLKRVSALEGIVVAGESIRLGGLVTLSALERHPLVRERLPAVAEAARSVATPQIRNAGTLAGNVVQRPWCWYYRNGFPCYKAGGDRCFSAGGENQLHAIFGGGPSYIVHPSDVAPALVAHDATFRVVGPAGERSVRAADFFVLPRQDALHENVLADDEILASVEVGMPGPGARGTYLKEMDRETWTHALASAAVVMDLEGDVCRSARIVLGGVAPVPWRVPEAEALLAGRRVTAELARQVGEAAVAGARPLAKNAYKVPLTRAVVERAVRRVAGLGEAGRERGA
ncbi:MAG TPA: FAD binding domain-containing protein [Longimicrobiales bacterium]|nr:FAD binding domain-containing protein [Longimicrobiales bacterium]